MLIIYYMDTVIYYCTLPYPYNKNAITFGLINLLLAERPSANSIYR